MLSFAIPIFLGAFLLFLVQPLLGRYILPWFGGGPSIWTSCMLFFQALLLGGYAYAHLLSTKLKPSRQAQVHMALLALSLLALPLDPDGELWRNADDADPTGTILLLLLVTAGLPYVILSATSPLLQHWFHRAAPAQSPYRLYALSNAGSLLALLGYPFLIEPLLTVRRQADGWSLGYVLFVAACSWSAWRFWGVAADRVAETPQGEAPSRGRVTSWLALATVGSTLLLATTNQMSQEVAVVPFLWILPLTLYLLSFILCFESDGWYRRSLYGFGLAGAVPLACLASSPVTSGIFSLESQIVVFSITMFIGCMVCHGELAARRPPGEQATGFYLWVALGGALGGVLVALVAPRVFPGYWEYPLSLAAACLLGLGSWIRAVGWHADWKAPRAFAAPPPALLVALFTVGYVFSTQAADDLRSAERNFYGVLRVDEEADGRGEYRRLTHGKTEHGTQYLDEQLARIPTTYFGEGTGAALALQYQPFRRKNGALRIGVIGLGAGTLASYAQEGDWLRFYEINPAVVRIAEEDFRYLSDSGAEIEVVEGDARIRMERELSSDDPPVFDILIVDAFSSGAIPIHLLTGEAGEVYARLLTEDGLLLFHISNRFLNLAPVLKGMGDRLGMESIRIESKGDSERSLNAATWMILTRNATFLRDPEVASKATSASEETLDWTDDFAGLWQALR